MNNVYQHLMKKMGRFKTGDWTEEQLLAEKALIDKKESKLPSAVRAEVLLHLSMLEENKQMAALRQEAEADDVDAAKAAIETNNKESIAEVTQVEP